MKLISFNVNGIRARMHQVLHLLETEKPDLMGLQEVKVVDAQFPLKPIEDAGYHVLRHGQKGHYGVAMLTRKEPVDPAKGFPSNPDDAQRRMVACTLTAPDGNPVRVFNGYFPQGEGCDHPVKFPAKRKFYADLIDHLRSLDDLSRVVVMGDFNIAPEDSDIGIGDENAKRWLRAGKSSFLPEEREWFQRFRELGFHDAYRLKHPSRDDRFSWFDYRSRGFEADPKRGLRIDFIMVGSDLRSRVADAGIDYETRGMEKPSDHAPIWADLSF